MKNGNKKKKKKKKKKVHGCEDSWMIVLLGETDCLDAFITSGFHFLSVELGCKCLFLFRPAFDGCFIVFPASVCSLVRPFQYDPARLGYVISHMYEHGCTRRLHMMTHPPFPRSSSTDSCGVGVVEKFYATNLETRVLQGKKH
jgi:hypothetical protein